MWSFKNNTYSTQIWYNLLPMLPYLVARDAMLPLARKVRMCQKIRIWEIIFSWEITELNFPQWSWKCSAVSTSLHCQWSHTFSSLASQDFFIPALFYGQTVVTEPILGQDLSLLRIFDIEEMLHTLPIHTYPPPYTFVMFLSLGRGSPPLVVDQRSACVLHALFMRQGRHV